MFKNSVLSKIKFKPSSEFELTKGQRIELYHRTDAEMKNEVVKRAFDECQTTLVEEWLGSKIGEDDKRKQLSDMVYALNMVKSMLQSYINDGEMEISQNDSKQSTHGN